MYRLVEAASSPRLARRITRLVRYSTNPKRLRTKWNHLGHERKPVQSTIYIQSFQDLLEGEDFDKVVCSISRQLPSNFFHRDFLIEPNPKAKNMKHDGQPRVSIVTPVYNGQQHLRECIESVLSQSYQNWDYTIVDNCSTDGTLEIAKQYSSAHAKIRVVQTEKLVPIIQNYNNASRQVTDQSKYCKFLAADDWLDPECLERMVALAEAHPAVAMVGAYGFDGKNVLWAGVRYPASVISGREACRMTMLGHGYVFGTPTSLLYRADIVRSREHFFNIDNIHADTEACLEFLPDQDFGFVHQVLTFSRVRDDSMTQYSQQMNTYLRGNLYALQRFGPIYLTEDESRERLQQHLTNYYKYLARSFLSKKDMDFWKYHANSFESVGLSLDRFRLAVSVIRIAWTDYANPTQLTEMLLKRFTTRRQRH